MANAGYTQAKPLSTLQVLAFACTAVPLAALTIAVAVFLPQYFASFGGLTLPIVGGIFATVRMLDLGVDFALGIGMDRTATPFGRYRPWMVLGAPILMLAVYMLFMAPPTVDSVYLIGWLLVMYLGTSILNLSHTAWASTLATTYDERSRVFGALTGVGVIGAVIALLVPVFLPRLAGGPLLPSLTPGAPLPAGLDVHVIGWMIIVLTPLTVGLVVLATKERIAPQEQGLKFRWRDYWELVTRPSMARVLLADICLTLGPGWMSALYFYYFTLSRGFDRAASSLLLLIYIAAGLVGAPLMGRLAMRIGKDKATIVSTTFYSLTLIVVALVPRSNFLTMIGPMFFAGFMAAGFTVLTRAMTADIADEVRLEQGKERTGLLFAITTLTAKLAGAFAIFLTFVVLDRVGFVPAAGAGNSPQAIHNLELVYMLGPIGFVMLGGACFIGYKLTGERHAEIRRQLEARDAALYDEAPVLASITGDPGDVDPPHGDGSNKIRAAE